MQAFSALLTPSQAAFLHTLLPHGFALQPIGTDSKRNRAIKKLDSSFTADYGITTKRKPCKSEPQASEPSEMPPANAPKPRKVEVESELNSPELPSWEKETPQDNFLELIQKLKTYRYSYPFRYPVDPVAQGVPDYLEIVKEPMDLSTIEKKLKEGAYDWNYKLHADIAKVISNSYLFNSKESKIYEATKMFEAYYLKLFEGAVNVSQQDQLHNGENEKDLAMKRKRIMKTNHELPIKAQPSIAQQLTSKERQSLFHQIYELSQKDIIELIKIIDDGNLPKDWREFELDFNEIDNQKYKKIVKLVNKKRTDS